MEASSAGTGRMNFAPALLGAKQPLAFHKASKISTRAVAEKLANGTSTGNGMSNGTQMDIHGNDVHYGPTMNVGGNYSVKLDEVEAPSAEVQAILEEKGITLETSGLKFLSNKARVNAHHESWFVCNSSIPTPFTERDDEAKQTKDDSTVTFQVLTDDGHDENFCAVKGVWHGHLGMTDTGRMEIVWCSFIV